MVYGNRRSFLNNLPLAQKKMAIFSFFILLFVSIFFVNNSLFNAFRQAADEKVLLMEMLEDLLEARFAAMELRAGKTSGAGAEGVTQNIAELDVDARRRIETDVADPDLRSALVAVVDGAARYGESFAEAWQLQLRIDETRAELDRRSAELEGTLEQVADAAAASGNSGALRAAFEVEKRLAVAKLNAERFFRRRDEETLQEAARAFSAADEAVADLAARGGVSDAQAERLRGLVGTVSQITSTVADLIRRQDDINTTELDVLGPEVVGQLEAIIDDRIRDGAGALSKESIETMRWTMIIASSSAILFAIFAAWLLIRSIVVPIRALTRRLSALSGGDTDFAVRAVNSTDEMGTMWTALGKLRGAVEEAYTRSQMLDQSPDPILVADPEHDFRLVYMNEAARTLFGGLRQHLPCDVDELVGRNIDFVFEDPREARASLSNPATMPWRKRVNFKDAEHFNVKAVALKDKKGRYVGAMLALRRVTEQVRSTTAFETNIKSTVDQIGSTFSQMRDRIETIARSVESTQGQLSEGSEAASEATAAVQMVASAAEELTSSIAEIADRLAESSRRAMEASQNTGDVARRAQELSTVSQRITEVVDTISDIADKTNLLALNATIEAASAGAAGKGFAVVAAEVKNLANQTAKATDEVSQQMASIQQRITSVTEGITTVAQVIEEINGTFASAAAAAEEQQAATREITVNAQNAAGGAETAATTIRMITSASASNIEATRDLADAARELSQANDNLSRQSDEFLSTMKG